MASHAAGHQPTQPAVTATVDRREALAYLARDTDRHFLHLGALLYDPLRAIVGLRQGAELTALILVVEQAGALPEPLPTMMVAADGPTELTELVGAWTWPEHAVWVAPDRELLAALEARIGVHHSPGRGVLGYGVPAGADLRMAVEMPRLRGGVVVRQLGDSDADTLDLTPCVLSSVALRGWLARGWRVFGAIADTTLLAHALAAYPIAEIDEIAAVYTAGRVRRQGLGAAVVGMVLTDIHARGRRALYIASRTNHASRRLAERLGLQVIGETWEITAGG